MNIVQSVKNSFTLRYSSRLISIFEEINKSPTASEIISEDPLVQQMIKDIGECLSEKQQKTLWYEIEQLIKQEHLPLENKEKTTLILKAMATYATSNKHYGPVVTEWAESLLDTAVVEGRKLVFLARDGIAPYHAARVLKAANLKKYSNVSLHLIYVSRTLAYTSTLLDEEISRSDEHVKEYVQTLKDRDPDILRKYIQQECFLKEGDKCLFVDVGFAGSIIPPIKRQLRRLGVDSQFCYLVSHTTKEKVKYERYRAKGFLAHREKRPLGPVDKAGGNPAVHWIEDTHQYIYHSPKVLIKNETGKIVPATVEKKDGSYIVSELLGKNPQTCKNKPDEYLIKSYGLRGVLDCARSFEGFSEQASAWREATEERRQVFGLYLEEFRTQQRQLLIAH